MDGEETPYFTLRGGWETLGSLWYRSNP
jgi:hypothetical protein